MPTESTFIKVCDHCGDNCEHSKIIDIDRKIVEVICGNCGSNETKKEEVMRDNVES